MKNRKIIVSLVLLLLFACYVHAESNYRSYQSTITSVGAVSVTSQPYNSNSVSVPTYSFGSTSSMLGGSNRGRMLLPPPSNWGEPGTENEDGDPEFWTDPGDAGSPIGDVPWGSVLVFLAVYAITKKYRSTLKHTN